MKDKDIELINRTTDAILCCNPSFVLGMYAYKNYADTLSIRVLTDTGLAVYLTDSVWTACESYPPGRVTRVQKESDPDGYERIFLDFEGTVKAL